LLVTFFHFIKGEIPCDKNGNDKIASNYIMVPWPILGREKPITIVINDKKTDKGFYQLHIKGITVAIH